MFGTVLPLAAAFWGVDEQEWARHFARYPHVTVERQLPVYSQVAIVTSTNFNIPMGEYETMSWTNSLGLSMSV